MGNARAGIGDTLCFEDALRRDGIKPEELRISLESPSNEAVRAAVEAGAGATAMSHTVIRAALASGQLGAVQFRTIERPFLALLHRQRCASFASRDLLKDSRQCLLLPFYGGSILYPLR
jgi:DNA-binding transcriptional LysR family regulator